MVTQIVRTEHANWKTCITKGPATTKGNTEKLIITLKAVLPNFWKEKNIFVNSFMPYGQSFIPLSSYCFYVGLPELEEEKLMSPGVLRIAFHAALTNFWQDMSLFFFFFQLLRWPPKIVRTEMYVSWKTCITKGPATLKGNTEKPIPGSMLFLGRFFTESA